MDTPDINTQPLGHTFFHAEKWYFFDAGSNMIFEVDPVLAAVLSLHGLVGEAEIFQQLSTGHNEEEIRAAIDEITVAQNSDTAFMASRPQSPINSTACINFPGYENNLQQLTLTLTEQCNLRCKYCLHGSSDPWTRPHGNQKMSLEIATKALLFFGERCCGDGYSGVSFYGGEPLLEFPTIKSLVKLARGKTDWPRLTFTIDTNGTRITDEMAEFICAEEIHLQISLDGPELTHDRHRKTIEGGQTYQEIMFGLERILNCDPEASRRISFIATLTPPFDFLAIADSFFPLPAFKKFGITQTPTVLMNVASLQGLEMELFGEQSTFKPQMRENLNSMRSLYVEAHHSGHRDRLNPVVRSYFDRGLIQFYHRSRGKLNKSTCYTGACQPGQKRLHVKVDGTFQPCERVGERFSIGHVDKGFDQTAIRKLWNQQLEAVTGRCSDCWAWRLCSLCYTSLGITQWGTNASGVGIPETFCEQMRSRKLETIKLYLDLKSDGPGTLDFLLNTQVQ
jgi:uncharacterized protein